MPAAAQRDSILTLAPPWLRTGKAERFIYNFGLMSDALLEKMNQAAKAHMPGQCDASALPFLGADRVMVQGPNEPAAAFASRLSGAFDTWRTSGMSSGVLSQIQAYLTQSTNVIAAQLPEVVMVGGNAFSSVWDTVYTTTPQGGTPARVVTPSQNFNWDNSASFWRSWLILFFSIVPTGLAGTTASILTGTGTSPLGQLVSGVWVPSNASGPSAFFTVSGLSGLSGSNVGQWLTFTGCASSGNNGAFPITQVLSAASAVVANPNGVATDAHNGAIGWSLGTYPIIGPGPVWDAPGAVWDDPARSWGLNVPPATIQSIRAILRTWKSANAYVPNIIIAFDGQDGRAGAMFSPYSAQGSGNPDGTWGSVGRTINGVWVPARITQSPFDEFCDGTGVAVQANILTGT